MAPHLLTLPGEVANIIYEYCTDDDITVEVSADGFLTSMAKWKKKWKLNIFEGHPEQKDGDPKELVLTKICRQIRFEALPILARVGHNSFQIPIHGPFTAQVIAPLPQAYLGNIREVHLWKTHPTLQKSDSDCCIACTGKARS